MTAPRYILTRALPDGQEKTSGKGHARKGQAAREAARSHHDNTGADRSGMDEVYDALMRAIPSDTVGPFRGYSYRIDVWRVEP